MQAKFQIKFLAYCEKKYGAPDLLISHFMWLSPKYTVNIQNF